MNYNFIVGTVVGAWPNSIHCFMLTIFGVFYKFLKPLERKIK